MEKPLHSNALPIVSLIIVTYNSEDFISECLVSVKKQEFLSFETIIVDNNSKDRTVEIISGQFPWVRLIKSNDNLGFTGGVNLGFSHSKGKYIALLNPDTRAESNWLANLVSVMNSDEVVGICASLMLKWGSNLVDTAGDGCTRAGKGYKIGCNQFATLYQESREVFTACGGAVLYRRKMIEEIGFFDSEFFLLHEDTDLGFRARLFGWSCRYVHNAIVEHKVSASIGYKTSLSVYHSVKNSDMVWLKNMPGLLLFLTFPEKLLNDIILFFYLGIIHRKSKDFIRAKIYVLKILFKILHKRKNVQKQKKISNRQLLNLLTPFLSMTHLSMLYKDKNSELKNFTHIGGGSNKAQDIGNNSDF